MKVMNMRLVRTARRFDFIWSVLAAFKLPTRAVRQDVVRVLLVDLHLVGDMVMLVPLARALRQRYPSARITLLAGSWAAAVFAGTDAVDEIVFYEAPWVKPKRLMPSIQGYFRLARRLRASHFDLGIDVRGDIRQILLIYLARCRRRVGFVFTGGAALLTDVVPDDGKIHHILDHHERIATVLGCTAGTPFVPMLKLTPSEAAAALLVEPYIGFHFGASLPLRRLPASDAATLIDREWDRSHPAVLFLTPDMEEYVAAVLALLPRESAEAIQCWRGDLRQFIVHASRSKRLYAMDSGPAHISTALGRKTIVFFGPNLPQATAPRGANVRVVEDISIPCRPCDQHHCINPIHQACMRELVGRVAPPRKST